MRRVCLCLWRQAGREGWVLYGAAEHREQAQPGAGAQQAPAQPGGSAPAGSGAGSRQRGG